jgi:hypothetical protein
VEKDSDRIASIIEAIKSMSLSIEPRPNIKIEIPKSCAQDHCNKVKICVKQYGNILKRGSKQCQDLLKNQKER